MAASPASLRDQMLFPDKKRLLRDGVCDRDLIEALHTVGLEYLVKQGSERARLGTETSEEDTDYEPPEDFQILDAVCDWAAELSRGEQQKITFARLLLSSPELAFLDETSSALDPESEERLYRLVRERIGAYISVGHRGSLKKYHNKLLEIRRDRTWRLTTLRHSRSSEQRAEAITPFSAVEASELIQAEGNGRVTGDPSEESSEDAECGNTNELLTPEGVALALSDEDAPIARSDAE